MDHSTEQIIEQHRGKPGSLIQVLMALQEENGWLPREVLAKVSEELGVPLSQVLRLATFYKTFKLLPEGRHKIHVCTGSSCHTRGAQRVLAAVQELTGARPGETDPKAKFSLETVNCLGCCNLGPVVEIDGKTLGRATPAEVASELKKYE
ncbi:MAG: NAD(P)H-dependent oxidoreductase subunit E [Desulfotomaculales bacterium]